MKSIDRGPQRSFTMKRSASPDPAQPAAAMDVDDDDAMGLGGELVMEDPYYAGYVRPSTHRVMLQDGPRMAAYAGAIRALEPRMRGRVVLDAGCGTGVLAMMCARLGGAARVYAVEASGMARAARAIVEANGLDGVVTVIEGHLEAVQLPEQVDVLVSEWMGFHLVNESMLDAVLGARDRWLRPGGVMIPQRARIWAAPVQVDTSPVDFWGQPVCDGMVSERASVSVYF